jgi:hypothetical protein
VGSVFPPPGKILNSFATDKNPHLGNKDGDFLLDFEKRFYEIQPIHCMFNSMCSDPDKLWQRDHKCDRTWIYPGLYGHGH